MEVKIACAVNNNRAEITVNDEKIVSATFPYLETNEAINTMITLALIEARFSQLQNTLQNN